MVSGTDDAGQGLARWIASGPADDAFSWRPTIFSILSRCGEQVSGCRRCGALIEGRIWCSFLVTLFSKKVDRPGSLFSASSAFGSGERFSGGVYMPSGETGLKLKGIPSPRLQDARCTVVGRCDVLVDSLPELRCSVALGCRQYTTLCTLVLLVLRAEEVYPLHEEAAFSPRFGRPML